MDAVLFTGIAVVLVVMQMYKPDDASSSSKDIVVEDVTRVAKLNDSFYEDPDAVSEIAHALGFPKGV